jgi:hypothetical protein
MTAVLLLIFNLGVPAQSGKDFSSGWVRAETHINLFSIEIKKISFSGNNFYAGLNQPASINSSNYMFNYHDVYVRDNMPTLNQLKSSMMGNIDMTENFSSRLNFDLENKDEQTKEEESESFFSSSLFYFLGAAVLATTFYIIWQDNENETTTRTFGYPPRPETDP